DVPIRPRDRLVALVQRTVGWLDAVPVVVERAERKQFRERRQSTHMIAVPMTDDDVVDPRQAHRFRCGGDALGVAVVVAGKTGIEKQRLSIRGDEERGSASLDINPGNL